jgi:hypothetical protein
MEDAPASEQIDGIIKLHGGWKAEILSGLRAVIKAADPDVVEEVKWKMSTRPEGLPVWSHNGMVCFAEIWKDNVKLIFSKGARLKDPNRLFNARLKSSAVRAIELHEGSSIDETALKALFVEAVQLNTKA